MIEIKEKPDNISWDAIHELLWEAHSINRRKGVIMSFASLPGYKLKEKIESGNGKLFVAMDGDKIVGTGAYTIVHSKYWFANKDYLYLCLGSVLPEYNGKGIYKQLYEVRESEAKKLGYDVIVFETHEHNNRTISINMNRDFHKVSYKRCKDHNNVIMAKWLSICPHTLNVIHFHYFLSKFKVKLKILIHRQKSNS